MPNRRLEIREPSLNECCPRIELIRFEPLPDIYVTVRHDLRAVLESIARLAEAHDLLTVEQHFDALGNIGWHVVNIRSSSPSEPQKRGGHIKSWPGGHIKSWPDRANRLRIECEASAGFLTRQVVRSTSRRHSH